MRRSGGSQWFTEKEGKHEGKTELGKRGIELGTWLLKNNFQHRSYGQTDKELKDG